MSAALYIIPLALVAALATMLGALPALLKARWSTKALALLMAIASGVLLSTAFAHLLPEALEVSAASIYGLIIGFLAMFVLEHFMLIHACLEYSEACELHRIGLLGALGLFLHSLFDGFIIALGFAVSLTLGAIAFISVVVHELPEGLATTSLLLAARYPRRQVIGLTALVALATPLGALLTLFAPIGGDTLAAALGLAAGTFIYSGATDLLPRLHKERSSAVMLVVIAAFAAVLALKFVLH